MYKIGIIGGTGYTGGELARLLCNHPEVEIASMTSRQNAGKRVSEAHPYLKGYVDLEFTEKIDKDVDLVFVATPHGVAMKEVPQFMEKGVKCIDLSGDYRMHDVPTYEKWYGHEHTDTENLKNAVYGLPELFRDKIKGADLVANPGCYATASILTCAPLMKAGVIESDIDIDAKSGTSGAGMTPLLIALARSEVASESPTPATMTGSMISGISWSSRISATVSTISALYSMPVLIALMSTSFRTASSWSWTMSSGMG